MRAFPLVFTVVVAVGFEARAFVLERTWSFPEAANSDPVNNAPVTTLTSMRFVFISLFSILKIRREKQARLSHFLEENSEWCSPMCAVCN